MSIMVRKEAIALFVRNPVPGRVKTRLARHLGDVAACELYQAMVADTLDAARSCAVPLYLFHDGACDQELPAHWLFGGAMVMVQRGGSLGEKMAAAFQALFSRGYGSVALAGSDIPGLDAMLIARALADLNGHDASIVPAMDGGYCLIALKRETYRDSLFTGIPWSTAAVLQTTLGKMHECSMRATLLPGRRDLDTLEDILAYCRQPAGSASATNRWLADSKRFDLWPVAG
jgi:rSAM/selenodomain-associated transferase 1